MKTMSRFLYPLLALAMLLPMLAACGDTAEAPKNGADGADVSAAAETTEEAAEETVPALPDYDGEGEDFTILSYPKGDSGTWHQFSEFGTSSEAAGDLVNDAVYDRNMIVEGRYNVTIVNVEEKSAKDASQNSILAGDDAYDVALTYIDESLKLAQEGLLTDFHTLPHLDPTGEWWDQAMIRDLALGGKLYILSGDLLMATKELMNFVGLNKEMQRSYGIEDPYPIVTAGLWTFDKLAELSRQVTRDQNGDGVLNKDDIFGASHDFSLAYYLYNATGERVATLDDSGVPQLTMNNARVLEIVDKLGEIYNDPQAMYMVSKLPNQWTTNREMFINNQIMLQIGSMYVLQSRRDMVSDFGILPVPKFNEQQDDYYNMPATWVTQCLTVPVTNTDGERTGILLEALCRESKDTVVRAYYEYNLQTKVARDEESGAMLDIIFTTTFYDVGMVFGWGTLKNCINDAVKTPGTFASAYAKAEPKALEEMAATIAYFQ